MCHVALLVVAVISTSIAEIRFWARSTEWRSAGATASGNAMINLGASVDTSLADLNKDAAGSHTLGLIPIALRSLAGRIALLALDQGASGPASPAGLGGSAAFTLPAIRF